MISPFVYLVCIVAEATMCFPSNVVTGWKFCMDEQPSAGGVLTATPRPGRFIAYDSDTSCGPVGCVVASGRFDRRELVQNQAGQSVRTNVIGAVEFFDSFERIDQYATSSCTFSRFQVLTNEEIIVGVQE